MSESVSAGQSAANSSSSNQTTNANGSQGAGATNASKTTSNTSSQAQAGKGYNVLTGESSTSQAGAQNATPAKNTNEPAESEFEEVKLGSAKGKVSRELAKTIKDLEKGFQTKAQEAASLKKLFDTASQNPREFFKQTGKDAAAFAEEILAEKYEQMNMSPEQKELMQTKEELNKYKSVETQVRDQAKETLKSLGDDIPKELDTASIEDVKRYIEHRKEVYQRSEHSLANEIGQAFTEMGSPADKHTFAKVAFEISSAAKQGNNLSAKDALAKVMQGYVEGNRERYSKMDGKRIHEELGDQVLDIIRKYDLEKINSRASSQFGQNQGQGASTSSQGNKPKKVLNELEWRKFVSGE
jgi:hypothetical protein